MSRHLEGRVAVVTGSGHGVGKAVALAMGREGASVVTNARRAEMAQAAADEIVREGGVATAFACDVSDFKASGELIRTAVERFGRVDILVNNAGNMRPRVIWRMTEEEWDSVIAVHLKGTFNCIRHASVHMKEQGYGRIVNTISGAWLGIPGNGNYSAAKAGTVGLTLTVAEEMARYGVTCNCYGPIADTDDGKGMLDKEAFVALHRRRFEEGYESRREFNQLTNAPTPDSVPPLPVYLCSEEAAKVTGRIFMVCGNDISICSIRNDDRVLYKREGPWSFEELSEYVQQVLLT
ncbi:MAG: SDR family NAD(P)-dependent oxidoreductase [Deltaproteobacteria bacterium]|nr:SDR family NAD(P)-dependent oxidoreductase [Deltaproteobacteria bacterium]